LKYKLSIFFIIGLLIYLIDISLNSDENIKDIYISDQEITSLINAWKSQVGRNPNDDEISRIITNLVEEEILYREALLLGLDKEDRIIKRRLGQKISFLKQETLTDNPSNEELIEYFELNKDNYYINPTYSFTHYFFSAENNSETRANNAYQDIKNNNFEFQSDPFFLGKNFIEKSVNEIDRNFGFNFSSNFNDQSINKWIGPYKSAYGHHLILIRNTNPGYYPQLIEVLDKVELNLLTAKKEESLKRFIDEVKSEYRVIINPNLKF